MTTSEGSVRLGSYLGVRSGGFGSRARKYLPPSAFRLLEESSSLRHKNEVPTVLLVVRWEPLVSWSLPSVFSWAPPSILNATKTIKSFSWFSSFWFSFCFILLPSARDTSLLLRGHVIKLGSPESSPYFKVNCAISGGSLTTFTGSQAGWNSTGTTKAVSHR